MHDVDSMPVNDYMPRRRAGGGRSRGYSLLQSAWRCLSSSGVFSVAVGVQDALHLRIAGSRLLQHVCGLRCVIARLLMCIWSD